jgi:hypothetical protein
LYVADQAELARQIPLRVYLTGIDLFFDENTNWSALADRINPWNWVPEDVRLPFDKNYLTFRFGTLEYGGNEVYTRYKLESQDDEWTLSRGRAEAIFTNIQAGKYFFRVQSSYRPDFKDAVEATISVVIVPPFYRTTWFWIITALIVLTVAASIVRFRINQLNHRLKLEAALAESERKALRLQMNPHFVFNALDAISGFIFKNEPKEAVRYLSNFAKLMRITLESSREPLVPLQNEILLLKNYIELEQLRFNSMFDYRIEVDEGLDPYEYSIPPMLIQPFVENAILHGLRHKTGGKGSLEVHFSISGNALVCTISDNGIGRVKSAEINAGKPKKSLATAITRERIDLLERSRGERVKFEIIDLQDASGEASGTRVVIHFPLIIPDELS